MVWKERSSQHSLKEEKVGEFFSTNFLFRQAQSSVRSEEMGTWNTFLLLSSSPPESSPMNPSITYSLEGVLDLENSFLIGRDFLLDPSAHSGVVAIELTSGEI